jgi:protein-S-isoprenylcysteine O-methyltransferase
MTHWPIASYIGLVYFGSEFLLGLFRRAKSATRSAADRGSIRVLWIAIPVSMFLAVQFQLALPAAGWGPLPWINALGVVIAIAGLALRWYSILYLGRFFTVNVAIAADHRLIDTGPYRRIRHPSYTGALLAFAGLGVCTQNWASLAIIVLGTTLAFLYRIHVEEAALTGAFQERYRRYVQRTWRLVPGLY